jgi:hypothetical protein
MGYFCNAEYERCGGTQCYDDPARNAHRILRSDVKSEIIPHDLASNDNSGVGWAKARFAPCPPFSIPARWWARHGARIARPGGFAHPTISSGSALLSV